MFWCCSSIEELISTLLPLWATIVNTFLFMYTLIQSFIFLFEATTYLQYEGNFSQLKIQTSAFQKMYNFPYQFIKTISSRKLNMGSLWFFNQMFSTGNNIHLSIVSGERVISVIFWSVHDGDWAVSSYIYTVPPLYI